MRSSGGTRLPALDSLRGVAALSVVFCHVLWLYRPNSLRVSAPHGRTLPQLLSWIVQLPGTFLVEISPLHLATSGHEAVILFYLVSGCVLYLSYERPAEHAYRNFLVRRGCRLYVPYLVALGVAVGLNATVSTGHLAGMNDWINHTWLLPIDRGAVFGHVMLVGNFNTDLFLMPCWTLVHEMRIAFVFPALAMLVASRSRWMAPIGILLSVTGIVLDARYGVRSNAFITLHYAALFLVGAWLARERAQCVRFCNTLTRRRWAVLFVTSLLLYGYGRMIALIPSVPTSVADVPIALGAAFLVAWAMTNPKALDAAPVQWLGRVCYGLYLLHLSFMLAAMYLLRGVMPLWLILPMAIAASLAAAELFRRVVETPAIRFGRRITASDRAPDAGVGFGSSGARTRGIARPLEARAPTLQRRVS